MKKRFTAILALALTAALVLLTACGQTPASSGSDAGAASQAELVKLVVGASPAPHAEILEQVADVLKEQGIELVIQEFSDYVVPNTALEEGSLDANFFQHQPYLDSFNEEHGTNLVSAGKIHFEPLGVYPGKTTSLDDLADGALIGIPNDTTNEARALYLLEAQGLITLEEGVGFEATPRDIVDNPKNLQFKELEAAQLPVSLPDLDLAVINGNYAVGADIADTVLVTEASDSESAQTYGNVVAVRAGDESRPEILALVAALQSDAVRTFIENTYGGVVVPVF